MFASVGVERYDRAQELIEYVIPIEPVRYECRRISRQPRLALVPCLWGWLSVSYSAGVASFQILSSS